MPRVVKIDQDLAGLLPAYLRARSEEAEGLPALVAAGDLAALRRIGHGLKGSGGGYGLDFISELGARMEVSAAAGDKAALAAQAKELKAFLGDLEILYVPAEEL